MDVIELILQEHRAAERAVRALRTRADGPALREVAESLTRHIEAEERVLYPAVLDLVDDGHRLVQGSVEQHRLVEYSLAVVEAEMSHGRPSPRSLADLEEALRLHVEEEESQVLPRLRERANPDVLDTLARAVAAVEATCR
jgi:hemerythrin-like domain-containing protein